MFLSAQQKVLYHQTEYNYKMNMYRKKPIVCFGYFITIANTHVHSLNVCQTAAEFTLRHT